MAKTMRSELGKVRGLGSAHHGVHHWWMQRLTAIALLPLSLWMIFAILNISGAEAVAAVQGRYFFAHPLNALLGGLTIICLFYHLQLGLQVVIEDYVPNASAKFTSLIVLKLVCFVLAAACLFSLMKIAL